MMIQHATGAIELQGMGQAVRDTLGSQGSFLGEISRGTGLAAAPQPIQLKPTILPSWHTSPWLIDLFCVTSRQSLNGHSGHSMIRIGIDRE